VIADKDIALRISAIESLSPTLKRITFVAADGNPLPGSRPGAHIAVSVPGIDRAHRNSYSLVGSHHDRSTYQIIVRRVVDSRGGSAQVHEALQVGDVLGASLPNSQFNLQNKAKKHLLIGGGIGVTPFLSFLPVLQERNQVVEMHHFTQPGEVAIFEQLLLPHQMPTMSVHAGRATRIEDILAGQPLGTHLYICGPTGLMKDVEAAALGLGWPTSNIHQESFGASGGRPFTVALAKSGGTLHVGEHQSLLEVLEHAGLPVRSMCRGGACGECLTHVLAGKPEHRDHFLTETEKCSGALMMPCVSRSATPLLTLDL
jgi:ferredoxin-NADP reductase